MKKALFLFILITTGGVIACAQIGQTTIGRSTSVGVALSALSMPGKSDLPICKMYSSCGTPECPVYIFTGSGDWRIAGNWANGIIPPDILPSCFKIVINPLGSDPCVLLIPQGISPNASLHVMPGKRLIIPGRVSNQLN